MLHPSSDPIHHPTLTVYRLLRSLHVDDWCRSRQNRLKFETGLLLEQRESDSVLINGRKINIIANKRIISAKNLMLLFSYHVSCKNATNKCTLHDRVLSLSPPATVVGRGQLVILNHLPSSFPNLKNTHLASFSSCCHDIHFPTNRAEWFPSIPSSNSLTLIN